MKTQVNYNLVNLFLFTFFITLISFNANSQTTPICKVDANGNISEQWNSVLNQNYGILYTGFSCPVRVGIGTNTPSRRFDVRGDGYFSNTLELGANPTSINFSSQLKVNAINRQVGVLMINRPIVTNQFLTYGIKNIVNSSDIIAYSVTQESNDMDVFRVMGNGNVYATKVSVRITPFPDYVFDASYELMSLTELETYINNNKHLPNMPTAKTVEKEGADLGEVNRVLVEKTEELTLYIIQLNKELSDLKKEVDRLK